MLLLLLILGSFLIKGEASPYEDFIKGCVQKSDDGICDMKCYNFTGSLNEFEYFDCRNVSMVKYPSVTVNITAYPPNVAAYREHFEREVRELFSTRADIETTEEDLEKLAEEYIKNADDHNNKRKWEISLNFTLFLRECDGCPQGWDYIYSILHNNSEARIDKSKEESTPIWIFIILGILGVFALVFASLKVVVNRKRRADENDENSFQNTRRKRMAYCTSTWQIPEKISPKRRKGLSVRNMNLQQSHFSSIYGVKENSLRRTSTPHVVSHPQSLPPVPNFAPPPVEQGTLPKRFKKPIYDRRPKLIELMNMPHMTEDTIFQIIREKTRFGLLEDEIEYQDQLDHSTPLIMAVKKCWRKVAEELINLGADVHKMTSCPDSGNNSYSTILHHAIHNNDVLMLKMLLGQFCEKFHENLEGRKAINAIAAEKTPLMLCATSNRYGVEMAKLLVEAGADLADSGEAVGFPSKIKYLQDAPDPKHRTVLHYAADAQNIELLQYLLEVAATKKREERFDIDQQDWQYYTALWYAIKNVNYECIRLLLDAGAEQYTGIEKEVQPRTLAISIGDPEILILLDDAIEKKRVNGAARSYKKRKPKRRSSGYGSEEESDPLASQEDTKEEDGPASSRSFSHSQINEERGNLVVNQFPNEMTTGGLMNFNDYLNSYNFDVGSLV